jgi:hypothetical protein
MGRRWEEDDRLTVLVSRRLEKRVFEGKKTPREAVVFVFFLMPDAIKNGLWR